VGFAMPYPLPGVAGRFPFRRGLRGFYVVRQAGQRTGHSKTHSIGKPFIS
jgi:hypothetical protein